MSTCPCTLVLLFFDLFGIFFTGSALMPHLGPSKPGDVNFLCSMLFTAFELILVPRFTTVNNRRLLEAGTMSNPPSELDGHRGNRHRLTGDSESQSRQQVLSMNNNCS